MRRRRTKANPVSHIGRRYNKLIVVAFAGYDAHWHATWKCVCDCGGEKVATTSNLRRGHVLSCGCVSRDIIANAVSGTREHSAWTGMHSRCSNPNFHAWHRYGGRGITVCDEWKDFSTFLADMGKCPDGMTLDRIDNDKGYSASNCRWATRKQQQRNVSSNRRVAYQGRSICASELAEILGVKASRVYQKLRKGRSVEQIVAEL